MNKKRPTRSTPWTVAITALAPLAGCGLANGPTDPIQGLPRELSAAETQVIASSNQFAFDLFREMAVGEGDQNVLVSPLSASMALGMTLNGARGETQQQIADVLGFGPMAPADINSAYRGLLDLLPSLDPQTSLTLANSIWHAQGFVLNGDFVQTVRDHFDSEVASLNFESPSAPDRINDWVAHATRQRIPTIVDQIPPNAVAYLINALHFKGSWREQFDARLTRDDQFMAGSGETVAIRMMQRDGEMAVGYAPDFQVVDLPYGNGAYSMTLLLPSENTDLDHLVSRLDGQMWDQAVTSLASRRTMLELPRMAFEVTATLNEPLQALGMVAPFADGLADFSGLSPEGNLVISDVIHKTRIEVDEEGTEAAAATSVGIVVTSMPPSLRFDRPFLLAIRETLSGTIIFLGRVNNPVG